MTVGDLSVSVSGALALDTITVTVNGRAMLLAEWISSVEMRMIALGAKSADGLPSLGETRQWKEPVT